MPDVRLAATGMDSCPASDEDTEDELEALQNRSRARFLLPSTSRQPVCLRLLSAHSIYAFYFGQIECSNSVSNIFFFM